MASFRKYHEGIGVYAMDDLLDLSHLVLGYHYK